MDVKASERVSEAYERIHRETQAILDRWDECDDPNVIRHIKPEN